MINDFYDAVINHKNPLVKGEEALMVNRIIEAIYTASKENNPIFIKD